MSEKPICEHPAREFGMCVDCDHERDPGLGRPIQDPYTDKAADDDGEDLVPMIERFRRATVTLKEVAHELGGLYGPLYNQTEEADQHSWAVMRGCERLREERDRLRGVVARLRAQCDALTEARENANTVTLRVEGERDQALRDLAETEAELDARDADRKEAYLAWQTRFDHIERERDQAQAHARRLYRTLDRIASGDHPAEVMRSIAHDAIECTPQLGDDR